MRITEKNKNGFYELKVDKYIYGEEHGIRLVQVVGRYEDIEEELGIDLITLFKALKKGIWVKFDADFGYTGKPDIRICKDKSTEICFRERKWWIQEDETKLKDYGKTWALTREELL